MQQGGGSPFNDSPTTADPAQDRKCGRVLCGRATKGSQAANLRRQSRLPRGNLKHLVSPRDWAQLDQRKSQPPRVHNDAKEARGNCQCRVTIDSQSER